MQEEAYDALFELQDSHWWYVGARYVYRELIQTGLSRQRNGGGSARPARMLDIGCGTGGNLGMLSEFGPTAGIDISFRALKQIHQSPALGLVQASSEALPFATGSFDGAHLYGVIEHLDDDLIALQEALPRLPAGRLCHLAHRARCRSCGATTTRRTCTAGATCAASFRDGSSKLDWSRSFSRT